MCMKDYLEEALNSGAYLCITTKNDKKLIVKIISYDEKKVYYNLKNSTQESSINVSNVVNIVFHDKTKQKKFQQEKSKNHELFQKYIKYYKESLSNVSEDQKIPIKEELFNTIFDLLYEESDDNLLIKYLTGDSSNNNENTDVKTFILMDRSNDSQKKAIMNALNNKISVIEGPPGTGKTKTILSIIANLILENKKVIVVSKNNTAVENIIEEFGQMNLPEFYVRFGKKSIMEDLKIKIKEKVETLNKELDKISISQEDLIKLSKYNEELKSLELEINELIELKNLIVELKTQKKYVDKKVKIYNFDSYLESSEMKIISEKHASIKTLDRLVKLANKKHYNFFEKLILKYVLCIKKDNVSAKLNCIIALLQQLYLNKEIVTKEEKLLHDDLKTKQERVKEIYEDYVKLSFNSFNNYLKQNIKKEILGDIQTQSDLIKQSFGIYPLILTTADGFLFNFKNIIKSKEKIDCIIIDEATQCDVITGLPLLFATKKLVVVGDSKQLSAITNDEVDNNIDEFYRYSNNNFLNSIKNVFNITPQVLYEHYRCDYNIINFCNKYYYDNALKIYSDSTNEAISIMNADKYKGAERVGKSFVNKREIKSINAILKKDTSSFVITPFKEQANLLVKQYNKEMCGTIHSFQGKGADYVYFSAVLNDFQNCNNHIRGKNNLFTKELINVAVSRAKRKFILVCDKKYFEKNSKYVIDVKNLIDYIKIYGNEIYDSSVCIFDYLYKQMKYYKSNRMFDNIYEEVTYKKIKNALKNTNYKCYPKLKLYELVQNEEFLRNNPEIKQYIINGAHADFTIYDTRINKPILVVELDGNEHKQERQKIKDDYKDRALTSSEIKIFRMPSKEPYDQFDLKDELFKMLNY